MLYSNSENIIVKSVLAIGSLSELQKMHLSCETFSNNDLWFSFPDEFCQDAIVGQSRIKGFKLQNIFGPKDVKIIDINTKSRRNTFPESGIASSIFFKKPISLGPDIGGPSEAATAAELIMLLEPRTDSKMVWESKCHD